MKALPLSPISSWTEPLLEEQKTRVREYLRSAKREVSWIEMMEIDATFLTSFLLLNITKEAALTKIVS